MRRDTAGAPAAAAAAATTTTTKKTIQGEKRRSAGASHWHHHFEHSEREPIEEATQGQSWYVVGPSTAPLPLLQLPPCTDICSSRAACIYCRRSVSTPSPRMPYPHATQQLSPESSLPAGSARLTTTSPMTAHDLRPGKRFDWTGAWPNTNSISTSTSVTLTLFRRCTGSPMYTMRQA